MYELVAQYSPQILVLVLSVAGVALTKLIATWIKNAQVLEIISRAGVEVSSAVKEINQTWVDSIKASSEDGVLTAEEKARALNEAIAVAKSNIGTKGLQRLVKILGMDSLDQWLTGRVESAVSEEKAKK